MSDNVWQGLLQFYYVHFLDPLLHHLLHIHFQVHWQYHQRHLLWLQSQPPAPNGPHQSECKQSACLASEESRQFFDHFEIRGQSELVVQVLSRFRCLSRHDGKLGNSFIW